MNARILVIHDEQRRRDQLQKALEPAHRVTLCSDIKPAMELLSAEELKVLTGSPFDLIISAVHLDSRENLSVFDLLKWAKGNLQIKHVPFVLIDLEPSTKAKYVVDAVRGAASSLGANAFLIIDHFDAEAFLSQVNAYIQPDLRADAANEQNGTELLKPPIEAATDGNH